MRPSKDQWALELAHVTAKRATCLRRQVGCVLLNKRGHVLATGYNGVAAGQKHCNERQDRSGNTLSSQINIMVGANNDFPSACPGARSPSGTNLDACQAIHAEQNALITCHDVWTIDTAYVTASPCVTCVKILMNTSCNRIVFIEEYPHAEARKLWESMGREWVQKTI